MRGKAGAQNAPLHDDAEVHDVGEDAGDANADTCRDIGFLVHVHAQGCLHDMRM